MSYSNSSIPYFIDESDALKFWESRDGKMTDAEKAYVVYFLSSQGLTNKQIRAALSIEKVYEVTHLKRCGSITEEELNLWHRNSRRITLGHVRALAVMSPTKRLSALRDLLINNRTAIDCSRIAKGIVPENNDTARYERLASEVLGREVKIRFNRANQVGSITLGFHTLEDMERVFAKLGYRQREDQF